MLGRLPWEDGASARVSREALENLMPEQRRRHYKELWLRVTLRVRDELEVSGAFGTEMIYTGDPSPRPRPTATTSS